MLIKILGSSASEGWPALWCGCHTCRRAREAGGRNLRTRASLLIDNTVRIDLGPDAYCQMVKHDLDLSRLKYLFFTHTHADHFAPEQLQYIVPPFAYERRNEPIEVFANATAIARLQETLGDPTEHRLEIIHAQPYEPLEAEELTLTPILAPHKPQEPSLNYLIESADAAVLYACDTGFYEQETLDFLSEKRLDCLICECTNGFEEGSPSHLSFDDVLELRDTLASSGALSDMSRVIITHLSHNIGMLHHDIEKKVAPHGIEVAYDGLEISL